MMNDIQLSFETHADLAECMFELVEETKDIVCAVVFYDDAKQLLKELGYIEETVFANINLEDPEWNGYNKEYYITIDKDYEISVEPAWHEKSEWRDACYFKMCDGIVLVHSDANSKILEAIKDCECYEFSIDDDFECDGCCEECVVFDDDDEDPEYDYEDIIENIKDNLAEFIAGAIFLGGLVD